MKKTKAHIFVLFSLQKNGNANFIIFSSILSKFKSDLSTFKGLNDFSFFFKDCAFR